MAQIVSTWLIEIPIDPHDRLIFIIDFFLPDRSVDWLLHSYWLILLIVNMCDRSSYEVACFFYLVWPLFNRTTNCGGKSIRRWKKILGYVRGGGTGGQGHPQLPAAKWTRIDSSLWHRTIVDIGEYRLSSFPNWPVELVSMHMGSGEDNTASTLIFSQSVG